MLRFHFHRRLAAWSLPGLVYADSFVSTRETHEVIARLKVLVAGDPRLSLEVVDSEFILRYYLRLRGPGYSAVRSSIAWARLASEGDATRVRVRVVDPAWCSVVVVMLPVAAFVPRPVGAILLAFIAFFYVLGVASTRSDGRHIAGFVRSAASPIRR